jgi:hypothetical protein
LLEFYPFNFTNLFSNMFLKYKNHLSVSYLKVIFSIESLF